MNITRNNFREKFDELKEVINSASFVAIDCEFTGLSQDNVKVTQYDSPSEYFNKTYQQTSGYIAIQFGLTAFRVSNEDPEKFTYRSYNFYVYPQLKKQRFECQGDSMAFLGSVNFDFNKLFREGISYCDGFEAKKLREKFDEKLRLMDNSDTEERIDAKVEVEILVPLEEQELMDKIKDEIDEFLASDDAERCLGKTCNAFQRKLIYQLLDSKYRSSISASSRCTENNRKVIVIENKKSEEELREKRNEDIDKERQQLEDIIGFSNLIHFLSQTKKLIVGHNMLLDVIYIMKQFVEPLSDKLQDFKIKTHKTFPNLLDTKYMCTDDSLKPHITSSVLAHVLDTVSNAPFTKPTFEADSEEYAYSLDIPKEHEAGYDSFITGICFITMANYLKIDSCDISEKSPQLRPILNKIFTMRIDVNHINLIGKEPQPYRDHVFHLTMPKSWTNNNIYQIFRTFGNVHISWLDDTSAFAALHNRENATGLLKYIGKHEGVSIISFAEYKVMKNNLMTEPAEEQLCNKRKPETADIIQCTSLPKKKSKHQGTSQHFAAVDDW